MDTPKTFTAKVVKVLEFTSHIKNYDMQELIFEILTEITNRKREAGKEPITPIFGEVVTELKRRALQDLKDLETAGKIVSGDTINDKYFRIAE